MSDIPATAGIPKSTKFLCICHYGHSRSVALCRVLHGMGINAVAAGTGTAGTAIDVLAGWADVIAVMVPEAKSKIPTEFHSKIRDFSVGPDRWSNPYNQELLAILKKKIEEFNV